MNKSSIDQVRRLAAQPVAASTEAEEIVAQARELTETELAAVTGGIIRPPSAIVA
jgi:bacteriocin-like protein